MSGAPTLLAYAKPDAYPDVSLIQRRLAWLLYVVSEALPDLSGAGDGTYYRKPLDELLAGSPDSPETTVASLFPADSSSSDDEDGAEAESTSASDSDIEDGSSTTAGTPDSRGAATRRNTLFGDPARRQSLLATALTAAFRVVLLLRSAGGSLSAPAITPASAPAGGRRPLEETEDVGLHMFAALSLGSKSATSGDAIAAAKAAAAAAARSGRSLRTAWTESRQQLEHAVLCFFRMFQVRAAGGSCSWLLPLCAYVVGGGPWRPWMGCAGGVLEGAFRGR